MPLLADEVAASAAKLDAEEPGMKGNCLLGLPGWGEVFAPLTTSCIAQARCEARPAFMRALAAQLVHFEKNTPIAA